MEPFLEQPEEISEIPPFGYDLDFSLIIKGRYDVILGRKRSFVVRTEGGKKRCGGIGDIVAGVAAACSFWDFDYGPAMASKIVREATRSAFEKEGRGLTAPYIVR